MVRAFRVRPLEPNPSRAFVAALYVVFGVADLLLSMAAFSLGVREGNPLLAAFAQVGLFVPAKILLTAAVAGLILYLYPRGHARPIAWSGLVLMASIDAYHVWSLNALL